MVVFFKQKKAYEVRLSCVGSGICIRDRFSTEAYQTQRAGLSGVVVLRPQASFTRKFCRLREQVLLSALNSAAGLEATAIEPAWIVN